MNMNQKGFANIILIVVIVILVGAVGYFAFVKKSEPIAHQSTSTPAVTTKETPKQNNNPTPTPTPTQTVSTKIITLTSPKSGAIYSKSSEIRITGKTKPGYYIQVYGNYPAKDLQCLTFNSFSNGGAGQADANGNFDFPIAYEGYRSGQNTLVVAALQNSRVETCFPANNVSDVIAYTYTGPVPNP